MNQQLYTYTFTHYMTSNTDTFTFDNMIGGSMASTATWFAWTEPAGSQANERMRAGFNPAPFL